MRIQLFHFLSVSAASLALCCACVEEIEPSDIPDGPQPLVFTAAQTDMTLSTRAAADDVWEGDGTEYVAIKVGEEVKKYKVTSSAGALEPADRVAPFYRTDTGDIEVTAWYPYSDELPTAPSINTDQSTKDGREESNLMTASATAVFDETTTLAFSHQTALIKVSVTGEDGTAVTGATVTILGMVKAFEDGEGYYSALVPPCTVNTNGKLLSISVTKDGNTYVYEATPPSVLTFEAGKSYEYSFNLKRSLVTTGGIEVTLSGTELEYTGSTERPEVTVTYNGTALTEDTDYTLLWSSSTSIVKGNYTVTVKGKGAYIGSVEKSYSIVEAPPYVTFTASDAQTFNMTLPTDATAAAAIGTFEYSVGGGEWTKVTSGMDAVPFGGDEGNLRLRAGGESLRGTAYNSGYYSTISFGTTATVAASGDIRTLINGKEYATVSTSNAKFCYLFKDCTVLTSAPELPATDLASQCYQGLFKGCTKLSTAPVLNATTLASYCYYRMFSGCTNLKNGPSSLPATELFESCYNQMFFGCTSLEATPELNATTLASYCYYNMFFGCTNLKNGPSSLPATELFEYCYTGMFYGCEALETAPTISAESLAKQCCQWMFYGCTSLTAAPALQAKTLAEHCYQWMFQKCTNLTSAPALPAESLAKQCYYGMFYGCANLTSAPELPATTLASSCYYQMFNGCTALTTAPDLPATDLVSYCYYQMFSGCTNLKSVTIKATTSKNDYALKNWLPEFEASRPTRTIYYSDDATATLLSELSAIPTGWECKKYELKSFYVEAVTAGATVRMTSNSGPTIYLIYSTDGINWKDFTVGGEGVTLSEAGARVWFKAGSEADASKTNKQLSTSSRGSYSTNDNTKCNKFSFSGEVNIGGDLTSLLSPDGGVVTLSDYAFCDLFSGCTTLKSAEKLSLPSTTLAKYCYSDMFNGCTQLTTPPIISAATLKNYCCYRMFYGCSSLTTATELKATELALNCYYYMFYNCESLATAPELPATTLKGSCYKYMFYGCTNLTKGPVLPATTLASNCYDMMFYNCKKLSEITVKATTTASSAFFSWLSLDGMTKENTGTIYYSEDATYTILTSASAIPTGWKTSKLSN